MEQIKRNLRAGEIILWEYRRKENLLYIPMCGFFFGIFVLLYFFVLIFPILLSGKALNAFYKVFFLLLDISAILSLIFSTLNIRKKKRLTNLKLKDLRRYENIYLLTNERYIQKSYNQNFGVKEFRFSKEELVKNGDMVFVLLNSVKSLIIDADGISELRMDYLHDILNKNYKATWLGLEFTRSVPEEEFMEQLFKLIPFKKVKEDEVVTVYQRS